MRLTVTRQSAVAEPSRRSWRRGLGTVPAVAGMAFSVAWIAGLSVSSASTDVHSSGAQLLAGFAAHRGAATAQYVITEGVTSVLLAIVALVLARDARRSHLVGVFGVVAAMVGLAECALGIAAVFSASASAAADLVETVNRLDGVKMFVLAGLAVAAVAGARPLPRWLRWIGVALAVTIILSGLGYLLLLDALTPFAYVSLPLLMVWVTCAGVVLGRSAGSR
jgi:hypothetical protein